MKFNEMYWPDSQIEEIKIKYNELVITVFNDLLRKTVNVICKNFAGITNLCIWDDTVIFSAKLEKATNELFYNEIIKAYTNINGELDKFDKFRTLASGLLKLSLELTNGISCEIYCQSVEVE